MVFTDGPSAGCRLTCMSLAIAVGVVLAAPAVARAQAPTTRLFPNDGGMVLNFIKPDKAADFEEVLAKVREALMMSDKPERKQQLASWHVFKSPEMAGPNNLYVFVIHPPVQGADYSITNIITEAFPMEANDILQKFADAYAQGMNIVNLNLVQDLAK